MKTKKLILQLAFISVIMLLNRKAIAQVDVANHTWNTAYYVGWNSANDLNFKLGSTPTLYMRLKSSGDLDLVVGTNGYKISDNYVLRHNNNTADIFVGVGAGNATMSGHNNTLVGYNAGTGLTTGHENTSVGYGAGTGLTTGYYNTFVGYNAGSVASNTGWSNTGIGYQALKSTVAYGGCAVGYNCASLNTTGCSLTAMGENAMYNNLTANNNTAYGYNALNSNKSLSNNVAIGASALAAQNYNGVTDGTLSSYNVAVGGNALAFTNPTLSTNGIKNSGLGQDALYSNSIGRYNTGIGYQSGYFNQNGNNNSIFGYQAGYGLTGNSYSDNCFFGNQAGYSTSTGINNVIIGSLAGYSNTTSYKTYIGYGAGTNTINTSAGEYNTFVGYLSGTANTLGGSNTFVGLDAGYALTGSTANSNSGLGLQVLGQTTSGSSNTGLGYKAGYANTTGTNNTFVGYQADATAGTYTNCGAFGNGASTSTSNKYVVGNGAVTVIGGAVGWSVTSDGRFKINVQENVGGLDFINKLRPVTYNLDTRALDHFLNKNRSNSTDSSGNAINDSQQCDFNASTNIIHSGFIAQEIEDAALSTGFKSSIVNAPANSSDPYSLNYSEIVVPLVRAVQQLDSTNKALQAQLTALQNKVNGATFRFGSIQDNISDEKSVTTDVTLSSKSIVLDQNQPNPFKEQSIIHFFIPNDAENVKIIFTDSRGNIIKEVAIPEKGNGQLKIYAQDLSSGIYIYNILVDGVTIDSKKMVCTK